MFVIYNRYWAMQDETTMIYTHVKRKDLMQISNPLDTALLKIKKGDKPNSNVLLSRNI